ncbi:MAG: hypothetical protein ACPGJV_01530 [Bacteriovoracaceae bacterium]
MNIVKFFFLILLLSVGVLFSQIYSKRDAILNGPDYLGYLENDEVYQKDLMTDDDDPQKSNEDIQNEKIAKLESLKGSPGELSRELNKVYKDGDIDTYINFTTTQFKTFNKRLTVQVLQKLLLHDDPRVEILMERIIKGKEDKIKHSLLKTIDPEKSQSLFKTVKRIYETHLVHTDEEKLALYQLLLREGRSNQITKKEKESYEKEIRSILDYSQSKKVRYEAMLHVHFRAPLDPLVLNFNKDVLKGSYPEYMKAFAIKYLSENDPKFLNSLNLNFRRFESSAVMIAYIESLPKFCPRNRYEIVDYFLNRKVKKLSTHILRALRSFGGKRAIGLVKRNQSFFRLDQVALDEEVKSIQESKGACL